MSYYFYKYLFNDSAIHRNHCKQKMRVRNTTTNNSIYFVLKSNHYFSTRICNPLPFIVKTSPELTVLGASNGAYRIT